MYVHVAVQNVVLWNSLRIVTRGTFVVYSSPCTPLRAVCAQPARSAATQSQQSAQAEFHEEPACKACRINQRSHSSFVLSQPPIHMASALTTIAPASSSVPITVPKLTHAIPRQMCASVPPP